MELSGQLHTSAPFTPSTTSSEKSSEHPLDWRSGMILSLSGRSGKEKSPDTAGNRSPFAQPYSGSHV